MSLPGRNPSVAPAAASRPSNAGRPSTTGSLPRTPTFAKRRPQEDIRARGDQQKMHQQGIYRAIKEGRKEEVCRLLKKDPSVLIMYDAAGANPVHVAFLYHRTEIGKMLVTDYPELATVAYVEGEYCGENVLHIAIVHRDLSLVKWLVDREPELLNAETTGSFFLPGGDAYFGGYPLLFAVSSNQIDAVKVILGTRNTERGRVRGPHALRNQITTTDRFGNSALHMAVIHDLPVMYDFVVEEMRRHGLTPADIRHRLNGEKLTPLALAAAMGREEMFQHILGKNSIVAWDYGPVTCKLFPLGGLEQPVIDKDTGAPVKTAIQCMCAGAREPITRCLKMLNNRIPAEVENSRLNMVVSEEVRQVLDNKWFGFGQPIFLRKFGLALAHILFWNVSTVIPNHYHLDQGHLERFPRHNAGIILLEGLVLLLAVWRVGGLLLQAVLQRSGATVHPTGAAMLEARMGDLFSLLLIVTGLLRVEGWRDGEDAAATFAALIGWLHVFFFLLGFQSTGPFVIMLKETVQQDVRRFFSVYIVVLFGYSSALYLVADGQAQRGVPHFLDFMRHLVLLALVGDFPFDDYAGRLAGFRLSLMNALIVSYILLVVILLLNLLIAMMGNTYAAVEEQAEKRWYVERANLMEVYEAEFSMEEMQQLRNRYATPFGHSDVLVTSDMEFCLTSTLHNDAWKLSQSRTSVTHLQPMPSPEYRLGTGS